MAQSDEVAESDYIPRSLLFVPESIMGTSFSELDMNRESKGRACRAVMRRIRGQGTVKRFHGAQGSSCEFVEEFCR